MLAADKRRDAALRQAIAGRLPGGVKRIGHPVSYFLWLPLAQEVRADAIAMALRREKIAVSTAHPFAASAHVPHAIRLALGSVSLTTLEQSLQTVARVIADQTY
ncbi:DNA-binding transcriptional MocR family regulator [Paraburkholderia sp. UCT70]